jgi:type II secretory pathway pseudopilin PulG
MIWIALAAAIIVLVLGALVPLLLGRSRRAAANNAEIAARAQYQQLGHYVENPVATTDSTAETLLRRGRERWQSAGAALATARSAEDFELVAKIAAEGLDQVAEANARIGLPKPF